MSLPNLYDLCQPRDDVLIRDAHDSDFAADLAQVIRRDEKAPRQYVDPATFFANTHPTRGLTELLKSACSRLSGHGGEAASIFRLDTQYGGDKTHSLIALTHAARGFSGVGNVGEFLSPALVPREKVVGAGFDGENADPLNGRPLERASGLTRPGVRWPMSQAA